VDPSLPNYEPRIIEQFAEKLYRKASAFVVGSVVVGGALGAAFGAVPLTSLGEAWPVPSMFGFVTLLLGGVFGSAIGYVIGDTRSFGYRLQAQSALCQLQLERNMGIVAAAITAARQAPAPKPQQQPQQQVQPPSPPSPPTQPPVQPRQAPPPSQPSVQQPLPSHQPPSQPAPQPQAQPAQQPQAPAPSPPVSPPVSAARVA
jgi:outer membrane biosynthesis protein TonB